jgi:flagellin
MPAILNGGGRIRTNIPAENAYNALTDAQLNIANRQLRLSTGKRINFAADDVAGYITSRSLLSRVGSLRSAMLAVGDAKNVTLIAQEGLDNVNNLVTTIKESTATAGSGALGTDEKVALAQAAYRMAEQIQTVIDSTVFAGKTLLGGAFSGDFVIGFREDNSLITLSVDLATSSSDNIFALDLNSTRADSFAGIGGLDLMDLRNVTESDLGIFSSDQVGVTLKSLSDAITNINNLGSFVGGLSNRLDSQEASLRSQITNYNAAISRIEDADVAIEQLQLVKSQFLQQASVTSLAQANQNPQTFLQLIN